MFERFHETAVRSVHDAVALAEDRNDPGIGTEHLLVGVVGHDEELANLVADRNSLVEALDRLDREALSLLGIVDSIGPIRSPRCRKRRHLPFTTGAKQVMKEALRESGRLGHRHIGPEHILLAITCRSDADPAIRLLRELGRDPNHIRTELLSRLRRSA